MKRKERKLARLVLGALLASGAVWMPGVASAQETTIDENNGTGEEVMPNGNHSAGDISSWSDANGGDGNKVTMIGGTVGGIAGAWVEDVNATNNIVTIENGTVKNSSGGCYIYGGISVGTGTVSGNQIYIKGGKIGTDEYPITIIGGASTQANAEVSGNSVYISKGTIYGNIYGGAGRMTSVKTASNNAVNISGGTINGYVYGGYSHKWDLSSTGDVTYNTVNISGTSTNIGENIYGGYSDSGAASNNTVTISGGMIGADDTKEVVGGLSATGEASNNTMEISGGTIKGYIRGGSGDKANKNTVTISKDANIVGGTARIYGAIGFSEANNNTVNIFVPIDVLHLAGGDGGSGTGNTLNLAAKGVKVGNEGLLGFQNLNFYLPTNMTKEDVMLDVNGTAYVDGAKVGVMAQGKLENLTKDDKVTLLKATTLNGTVSQTTEITVPESLTQTKDYEFNVTSDTNNIYATITKAPTEEKEEEKESEEKGGGSSTGGVSDNNILKSPVEARAATVSLLNAGADMLASQGFAQAANAVALEAAESAKNGAAGAQAVGGFTPFAAFGGSSMRAESGSHVDTKGYGINVGFAREIPNSQGKLLFGPVVEYGGGKYDSYNNDVHADGNSRYWGIGIMARQVNRDGFYYEGSVRGGRVTSDYSANLPTNVRASYDSASNYWAAHIGLGKVFAAGEKGTVDGYLKYFYSHQSGDDRDINLGANGGTTSEHASFDSVDSNRVRIGARYTHKVNEMNSFYGGLAYQYEFGGEARAHYSISGEAPSPSVKGSSGMLELGWQVKPGGPVTIDLGVTGWAGKQRGGSVQLGATWTF